MERARRQRRGGGAALILASRALRFTAVATKPSAPLLSPRSLDAPHRAAGRACRPGVPGFPGDRAIPSFGDALPPGCSPRPAIASVPQLSVVAGLVRLRPPGRAETTHLALLKAKPARRSFLDHGPARYRSCSGRTSSLSLPTLRPTGGGASSRGDVRAALFVQGCWRRCSLPRESTRDPTPGVGGRARRRRDHAPCPILRRRIDPREGRRARRSCRRPARGRRSFSGGPHGSRRSRCGTRKLPVAR